MSRRSANALAKIEKAKAALVIEPVDYTVDESTWADHLSDAEQTFVIEWLKSMDLQKAARAAGYSENVAQTTVYSWVRKTQPQKPWLKVAMDFWRIRRREDAIVDLRMIEQRAKDLAFSKITDIASFRSHRIEDEVDDDGVIKVIVSNTVELKNSDDLSDQVAGAIKSVKQDANGQVQLEMHSPAPYLALLAKMQGVGDPGAPGMGNPIGIAVTVNVEAAKTPQEAALAWRAMIRGS